MSETVTIKIEGPSDTAVERLFRIVETEPNGILLPSGAILHVQPTIRTLDAAPDFGAKVRAHVAAVTVLVIVPVSTGVVSSIVAAEVERFLHDATALDCHVMRIEDKAIKLDKQGHVREVLTHVVETKCKKSD